MESNKLRRGKVEQTNEMAEVFTRRTSYNQAFSHQTEESESHTESDALYHHYSDDED